MTWSATRLLSVLGLCAAIAIPAAAQPQSGTPQRNTPEPGKPNARQPDASRPAPTGDPASADWKPLFDGRTLAGWHQVGDGEWVVEDGAIVGRTQTGAKLYGLLVSDGVYHDFAVRLKFKSIKGNSGFYIRMVLEEPDKAHGLQIEVDPKQNSGGIYESYARNWVSLPDKDLQARYFKPGEWNDLQITARGGDVTVMVNGVTSAQLKDDPSRPAGRLAMQMHAGNEMLVMFKDIQLQGEPKKGPDAKGPTTPQKITPAADGTLVLAAKHCRVTGKTLAYMPEWQALGFWRQQEQAAWEVEVPKAGTYDVTLEWSVDDKNAGNPYALIAGDNRLDGKVESTGRWNTFRRKQIGQIELKAGVQEIVFKANGEFPSALMDLKELRLSPRAATGN